MDNWGAPLLRAVSNNPIVQLTNGYRAFTDRLQWQEIPNWGILLRSVYDSASQVEEVHSQLTITGHRVGLSDVTFHEECGDL